MKNSQIFPSKVSHFYYHYRFRFSREISQVSIRLGIFKLLKNKKSFGKSFSFPFSAKYFDRNL